jgi:hypothetical protein
MEQVEQFGDERSDIGSDDQVLLIVENDPNFARNRGTPCPSRG